MKELSPPAVEYDIGLSSIQQTMILLRVHRDAPNQQVFFVIYTRPHVIYACEYEKAMRYGYDAVFYVPSEILPNNYAWDMIMYSRDTGQPIAIQRNRPL